MQISCYSSRENYPDCPESKSYTITGLQITPDEPHNQSPVQTVQQVLQNPWTECFPKTKSRNTETRNEAPNYQTKKRRNG